MKQFFASSSMYCRKVEKVITRSAMRRSSCLVSHCRVLPTGEFSGMIPEPLAVRFESFMAVGVTVMSLTYKKVNKYVSKTHINKRGGVQLKLCATPRLLFKGSIYVADCMTLSNLLKTITIKGSVECRQVCMKSSSSRFSTITAECSRLITT